MSGRARARPPSRSAPEPAGGPSRRSTRHQQQQQDAAQPGEEQQELDLLEQQIQQQQEQIDGQQPQVEAAMAAPAFHQNIDPAIAGPQDGGMPPPPTPSAKGLRGQAGLHVARRGTRRNERAPSMASTINSVSATDAFSSQPEPQNSAPQNATPARVLGTPARGPSVVSSLAEDTPSRNAARKRLMASMLPRLLTASDDLFTQLCSDQVDDEMWETERKGFKSAFDAYRAHYVGHPSDPVVNPDFVADAMGLDRASAQCDRVFRTVSAANLVSLLDEITPMDHQELLMLLQDWNSGFPDLYLGASSDNNDSEMRGQVINQVLTIRTQLAIFTLQAFKNSSEPFHPFEQVAKVWCNGDVSVGAVEAFLGNNEDALQLKPIARVEPEVDDLAENHNRTRLRSICSMLPNQLVQGDNLDLGQLLETYPIEGFVEDLRTFVKACFVRIKRLLQQEASVGADVSSLARAASDVASGADSQLWSQLATDSMPHSLGRAESGPAPMPHMFTLQGLKQTEQQASGEYGNSSQLLSASYPPEMPRPIAFPHGFSSSPAPASHAQQGGLPPSGSMYADSAALVAQGISRKRRAPAEPAQGGEETPGSSAKKQRGRRKKNEPAATAPASTAAPSSAPLAAAVAQSQYPPLPGTQDEPDLEAVLQRTKEISAAARKVKEPQVRSAWVKKDVALLIKAVHRYQCKWSAIEKEIKAGSIPFERPRDQQALRDKARLLKQDFLKVDALLPRGFDLVVLGKKEREAVKAVGKNPDRRESDVDENNRPVNTEPVPEDLAVPVPHPASLPPAEPQQEHQQEHQLQALPESQPVAPEPPAM